MKNYLKILLISVCFLAVVPSCKKDGKDINTTEDPIAKDAVTLAEARAEYSKALNQGLYDNFLDKSLTPNWEKVYRYRLSENHNALYVTLYYKKQTGEVIQMIVMKDNGKVQSKVVQAIPNPSTLKADKKIDYAHLDGRLIFFNSYGKLHGLVAVQNGKRLSSNLSGVNLQSSSLGDPNKDDDQDGVINKDDQCPNTPAGDMVDSKGCSLDIPLDPVIITPDPGPGTGLPPIDTGGGYPPIGGDPGDGSPTGPGGGAGDPGYTDDSQTTGTIEVNGNADPDFPSNCASWAYEPAAIETYQSCGVSDLRIDYITTYQIGNIIHIEYVRMHYDKNLYFEFPRTRADGTFISASEAARLTAQAKDAAEDIFESQVESSPPPTGPAVEIFLNRYLNILKAAMERLGGRATYRNNYGTYSVRPYTKGIGGC